MNLKSTSMTILFSWIFFYLIFPLWIKTTDLIVRGVVITVSLIVFIFTTVLYYKLNSEVSTEDSTQPSTIKDLAPELNWKVYITWFAIILVSNLPFLFKPISPVGDTSVFTHLMVLPVMFISNELNIDRNQLIWINIISWSVLLTTLFIVRSNWRRLNDWLSKVTEDFPGKNRTMLNLTIGLLLILIVEFVLFRNITMDRIWIRYPPIETFIFSLPALFFGVTNWGMRLIPIGFFFATSIMMYKLLKMYVSTQFAILGPLLLLLMPLNYLFIHYTHNTMGIAFFSLAVFYYHLRYIKNSHNIGRDYYMSIIFLNLGLMWRFEVILIPIAIFGYYILTINTKEIKRMIRYYWICAIPIVITIFYQLMLLDHSHDNLYFALDSVGRLFSFLVFIPGNTNYLIFSLFILSIGISYFYRSELTDLSFMWIITWFGFFAIQFYNTHDRFYVPMLIPISLLIVNLLYNIFENERIWNIVGQIKLTNNISKAKLRQYTYFIFLAILLIYSGGIQYHAINDQIDNNYMPYEETYSYISENIASEASLYFPHQYASEEYYLVKYDIQNPFFSTIWEDIDKQNITNLLEFLQEKSINYIFLPITLNEKDWGEEAARADYGEMKINQTLAQDILNEEYDQFETVNLFTYGSNAILISKITLS